MLRFRSLHPVAAWIRRESREGSASTTATGPPLTYPSELESQGSQRSPPTKTSRRSSLDVGCPSGVHRSSLLLWRPPAIRLLEAGRMGTWKGNPHLPAGLPGNSQHDPPEGPIFFPLEPACVSGSRTRKTRRVPHFRLSFMSPGCLPARQYVRDAGTGEALSRKTRLRIARFTIRRRGTSRC